MNEEGLILINQEMNSYKVLIPSADTIVTKLSAKCY
jgi:hypothetical protein